MVVRVYMNIWKGIMIEFIQIIVLLYKLKSKEQ